MVLPQPVCSPLPAVRLADWGWCAEAGEHFTRGAYCLGKVVWGKGWEELVTLLAAHKRSHPDAPVVVDAFGEGEALAAVGPTLEHASETAYRLAAPL